MRRSTSQMRNSTTWLKNSTKADSERKLIGNLGKEKLNKLKFKKPMESITNRLEQVEKRIS
jgi:hypothetical protein